ncbi:MAG: tyrosine-type recombinase/integrase [Collimonas sp.]|uniref:tyrosine-type recombinase/integrase n=1 Tax=Collimonas sp. TaxID=1963772 RepID=UPI0032647E49
MPARWRFTHGAYYYQIPPGQEPAWDGKRTFRLGSKLPEAYKVWAERIGVIENASTIGALLDRYMLEVVPRKGVTTQAHNKVAIRPLRAVFADTALLDLKPRHVYQYIEKRAAKISARREIEVLSHAFTKVVEWGYIDRHPFKGEVRFEGEKARTRYVEDWEVIECLALTSKRKTGSVLAVQAYIRLKLLTGMRRGDLLRLTQPDLKEDGIHVTPHKTLNSTGKRLIIGWSEEVREAVEMAIAARPVKISPYVFCNRSGKCYFNEETGRAGGWDSMWSGFSTRVLEETKVQQKFTEHDLRAKCASDASSLEHARALLAHADSRLTDRVYRRKPEFVAPLR